MAKRAQKKTKKKREPPWLGAARQRLRANADARHEEEMSEAFMELATPVVDSLGPGASEADLGAALQLVKIAWNLPIVHAASAEPGSDGAAARAEVEAWLRAPQDEREAFAPIIAARIQDFPHCAVLLADVLVRRVDGNNAIALRFHGDEVLPLSVLDVDESGWPKISHSLLELSWPARDLLTVPYGDGDAQRAIDLARVAWNLPVLDQSRKLVSEALRRDTLDAAARARKELPPAWRTAFEAMVTARETRFAYDRRIIVAAPARTQDGMIQVQAAAMRLDGVEPGEAPAMTSPRDERALRESLVALTAEGPEDEGHERAEVEAVADALLEMAAPEVDALPPDATDEQLDRAIGWAVLAYNQPLLDAIPRAEGAPESPGELLMKSLELGFERLPGLRASFERMLDLRKARFGHLFRPILVAKASWGEDGGVRIAITLARRELCEPFARGPVAGDIGGRE